MKKTYVLCIALICVVFICFWESEKGQDIDYFAEINFRIRNLDFCTATVEDANILLYDSNGTLIQIIEFTNYRKSNLIYIRKSGDRIYFVQSGSIDDESGILFVNDESDRILEGIKSLERVGGNSYRYSTR